MAQQEKFVRCKNRLVHINKLIEESEIPPEIAIFARSDGPQVLQIDDEKVRGRILPGFDERNKAEIFRVLNPEFIGSKITENKTEELVAGVTQEALFVFNPSPENWLDYKLCFFILDNKD